MASYDVAHIRQSGVNLSIVPLTSSFGSKSSSDQRKAISQLQLCASSAGLAGTVVPVWDSGSGRMSFIAPNNWHSFFKSINLQFVGANINKRLSCG